MATVIRKFSFKQFGGQSAAQDAALAYRKVVSDMLATFEIRRGKD